MRRKTVLIVDDEAAIREMVSLALETAKFNVLEASDSQEGHAIIIDSQPDVVLLDWMMPGTTGLELLRRLRRDPLTEKIPVILLTAKTSEDSKITGLDSGADDFISKPFSPKELVSRIRAVIRRSTVTEPSEPIKVGEMLFDPESHRVSICDEPVEIGPTEYRMLQFFLTHQERVYSRDQILDHVWGANVYLDERTVDVHIRRLRKAISVAGHEKYVQTVRGAGYRFSTRTK
ncbi:MAG: phosphate regulon transcriptional regulatory protein PhoB [Porticoccaceae bacterium]|nr:phosphate regulon transcriptional regulatory protein PhoB [Porticoccaceae bacterium]